MAGGMGDKTAWRLVARGWRPNSKLGDLAQPRQCPALWPAKEPSDGIAKLCKYPDARLRNSP